MAALLGSYQGPPYRRLCCFEIFLRVSAGSVKMNDSAINNCFTISSNEHVSCPVMSFLYRLSREDVVIKTPSAVLSSLNYPCRRFCSLIINVMFDITELSLMQIIDRNTILLTSHLIGLKNTAIPQHGYLLVTLISRVFFNWCLYSMTIYLRMVYTRVQKYSRSHTVLGLF